MANFNFQGKIIRQFWGKIIRQSTKIYVYILFTKCYLGGGNYLNDSLNINNTFFHYDIRAG